MDSYRQNNSYQTYNVDLPGKQEEAAEQPPVSSLARRIHGWSWQAFPIGMGTGAVYVTLSGLKEHSQTLTNVETVFFFMNIALFLLNTITLLLQVILYPRQALRLIKDPVKGIFVPLVVLSFATIIIGLVKYAVPSGHVSPFFVYDLFWVYIVFALVVCFPMLMIWFNNPHDLSTFTPAWAFLIFPMMLVGIVAINVLEVIPLTDDRALGVLLVGYVFQGASVSRARLGFFMTFFYICIYIIRCTGFLDGHQANGAFVACGPPGFTALALIKLGQAARTILPHHGLVTEIAGEVWFGVSVMSGLMLFGLAVFLFFFGLFPYWFKLHKHLREILGCWALTFPNVGWIATIRVLGDIFDIQGFYTWHLIMTILLASAWIVLIVLTFWAFLKGKIFLAKPEEVIHDIVDAPEDLEAARKSIDKDPHGPHGHGHGGHH
ncbi:voltage-dependent anion channel-domain-containing protein [Epithele typhae]|uniref:voltage-dependent anion channel-domain-containing protein n=1 Tax=Epithele typhae TaxID=378194 RepID=UPI0020085800|nr:voltage-dependent anion channel-domain-containing protein [Epithele typhae]KAH9926628.1 voltage-dependent anion channel-domain-containing protein [Epithele typhae]